MTGPFKWDLVNTSKGLGFSSSVSRTLKTHEIITAHKVWSKLDVPEKAAFPANCGQGVGATWAETAPEQGTPDEEWRTAARRTLRHWRIQDLKDERGDHTLACQRSQWSTRIHDRVRDNLARQLRRMGATVDLERVAPQWSKRYRDQNGMEKTRVTRIDVVATVPGSNELRWLDVTIRRPTALTNVEGRQEWEDMLPHKGNVRKRKVRHGEADQLRIGRETGYADNQCATELDDETGRSSRRRVQRDDGTQEKWGSSWRGHWSVPRRTPSTPQMPTRSRRTRDRCSEGTSTATWVKEAGRAAPVQLGESVRACQCSSLCFSLLSADHSFWLHTHWVSRERERKKREREWERKKSEREEKREWREEREREKEKRREKRKRETQMADGKRFELRMRVMQTRSQKQEQTRVQHGHRTRNQRGNAQKSSRIQTSATLQLLSRLQMAPVLWASAKQLQEPT